MQEHTGKLNKLYKQCIFYKLRDKNLRILQFRPSFQCKTITYNKITCFNEITYGLLQRHCV